MREIVVPDNDAYEPVEFGILSYITRILISPTAHYGALACRSKGVGAAKGNSDQRSIMFPTILQMS